MPGCVGGQVWPMLHVVCVLMAVLLSVFAEKPFGPASNVAIDGLPIVDHCTTLDLCLEQMFDAGAVWAPRILNKDVSNLVAALANEQMNHQLRTLRLYSVSMDDDHVTSLAGALMHTRLNTLDFRFHRVTDRGVLALATQLRLKTVMDVTTLHLAVDEIRGLGAESLRHLLDVNKIKILTLQCQRGGDHVATQLAKALTAGPRQVLSTLDLKSEDMTDAGLSVLAVALASSRITSLGIRATKIGLVGAQAFADMIQDHTRIGALTLSFPALDDEGQAALERAAACNLVLTFYKGPGNPLGAPLPDLLDRQAKRDKLLARQPPEIVSITDVKPSVQHDEL